MFSPIPGASISGCAAGLSTGGGVGMNTSGGMNAGGGGAGGLNTSSGANSIINSGVHANSGNASMGAGIGNVNGGANAIGAHQQQVSFISGSGMRISNFGYDIFHVLRSDS